MQLFSFISSRTQARLRQRLQLALPNDAVLSCAPEGVGPHGSRCNPFDTVSVVWEHVNGLLRRQVVHVHLGIGGSCDQDSVVGVREELQTHTFIKNTHCGLFTRHWLKKQKPDVGFTLTEKMLAACPVCIVMSFLCRKGSQMMACWSSEPEARRLERNKPNEFMKRHCEMQQTGFYNRTYSPFSFHSRQLTQPEWPWKQRQ